MKKLSLVALVAAFAMLTGIAMANVPAPPVNQILGFDDTEFNFLTEADCRVCHDSGVPDDHHLLYGSTMIGPGDCSLGTCDISGAICGGGAACPAGETCVFDTCQINQVCEDLTGGTNYCTRGEPCGTCSTTPQECGQDDDCPAGETCVGACPTYRGVPGQCGQPVCVGGSMAPNDPNAGVYGCLTCHDEDNTGGVINFVVYRDCTFCHEYRGGANVHHLDALDPVYSGAKAGNCVVCHGDLVDNPVGCDTNPSGNCSDTNKACATDADCTSPATCVPAVCDHDIPTYEPSLVTPEPAGGYGVEIGTCDYCHAPGVDTVSGVHVHDNHDTHHHTGFYYYADGSREGTWCNWCHLGGRPGQEPAGMEDYAIRTCENCHGMESLHNIQVDTDDPADGIQVGGEAYGFGHIGIDDPAGDSDCFGCHGFTIASDGVTGSGVPSIYNAAPAVITADTATQVTVTGAALISTIPAATSDVRLTAADGSSVTITPDSITGDSLTVTITAAAGSYTIQAVKDGEASNVVGLSVMPQVAITDMDCSKCLSTMTITGVNFAVKPAGTDEDISVTEDGRPLNVISWSDTEITVSGARCRGDVVVNGVYGSSE